MKRERYIMSIDKDILEAVGQACEALVRKDGNSAGNFYDLCPMIRITIETGNYTKAALLLLDLATDLDAYDLEEESMKVAHWTRIVLQQAVLNFEMNHM